MINVNDFKTGVTIKLDNNLFQVLEFLHVKPGKGPAFVRTKLKNLRSGATIDHTFNSGIKVEAARIEKKKMQYLYNTGESYNFMDMETYDQIELDEKSIKEEIKFLKENLEVDITFYESELLGVTLPEKVELEVVSTTAAVKGNTTSSAMKDAELETGYTIKVPLFIEENQIIVVSTKDGKYDSRK